MKHVFHFIFLIYLFSSPILAEGDARITSFSPTGVVKGIRQVKVHFSDQMVPFGDPRTLAEPFEINCPIQGISRWVDPKNYVYEFKENLPAGIHCSFILKSEIKTLGGKEIQGEKKFSFSTGGPAISYSNPYEGSEVNEDQVFILELDTEINEESVEKNLFFSVSGLKDQTKAKIITGKAKDEILKSQNLKANPKTLVVQSQLNFPNSVNVNLIWGKGIKSKTGVATTEDQTLAFSVRRPFIAQFSCERENPKAGCIPITPMYLNFTSPISWKTAKNIQLKSGNKVWLPKKNFDESDDPNFVNDVRFMGPFPQNSKFRLEIPSDVKDDSGRNLENRRSFPLEIKTEKYPPLAKFSARFGIIEKNAEPVLPVTLRNLEKDITTRIIQTESQAPNFFDNLLGKKARISKSEILHWLKKVERADRDKSIFSEEKNPDSFSFPKPNGADAFEVVGIPLKESGFYVVEVESAILGRSLIPEQTPMYVPTSALVTNMSVHLKWGREGSVVWVTSLDKGLPVADAKISIRDCNNNVISESKTDFFGISRLPQNAWKNQVAHCSYRSYDSGILVTAETTDDFSFVHSSWDKGIESWRFNVSSYSSFSKSVIAHTILDRTLFRAGETVSMKNLIRHANIGGISHLPEAIGPGILRIKHEGSDEKFFFNLKWNKSGDSEITWKIPKEAKLGVYSISLLKNKTDYSGWETSEFRVEEFRVPLMKGSIQPPKKALINPKEFNIDLFVQYFSGGGAGNLPIKVRNFLSTFYMGEVPGFEGFSFATGPVKEGKVRSSSGYEPDDQEFTPKHDLSNLNTQEISLDNSGSARVKIANLPKITKPTNVSLEMEYRDPNGEMQTVTSSVPVYPSKFIVGLKPDSWALSKESSKITAAVIDLKNRPLENTNVQINIYERKTYSHRKRLVGGFYAYEHFNEIKKVGEFCKGTTNAKGVLKCSGKTPVSGSVIFQATAVDDEGRESSGFQEVWIASQKNIWFSAEDHDRMDVLPEKNIYEAGETARFQIRTPFKNSLALVTIEREGVMESYVRNLTSQSPLIEIPVKKSYAPNVYISVLAVRGRIGDVKPTALVDLGRPSYRLGLSKIKVGWKPHELKVSVSTKKSVYGVREKVKTKILVKTPDGNPISEGEIAIAAVDEGLLELSPNKSWNVLSAMMQERAHEVKTATAQMQVVGRRHFGLKAAPPGGGGGEKTTRELFDTLLFWKSKIPLNSKGEAEVEIPLNDSLTKFRIVAIATSRASLFGNGSASIRTSQDLMLLSGIAPIAREDDEYISEFTVRNASDREMEVIVNAGIKELPSLRLMEAHKLKSGETKIIRWKVKAPVGTEILTYEIEAKENAGKSDKLRIKQKVVEAIPVRAYQATIARLEKNYSLKVEMPFDSIPNRGGIDVTMKKSLSEGLQNVRDYMQKYPYSCLEQSVSKSIALRDSKRWETVTKNISSYLDSDGLAKYFPSSYWGSEILTAYVLTISHDAGWELPESSRNRMVNALERFVDGSLYRRAELQTADLAIRKLGAIEALSKYGRAKPEHLTTITIEPNLWPVSTLIDWWNILYRMKNIPDRDKRITQVEDILRSRMNLQGTVMSFSSDKSDYLWWLMVSPDVNSARLLSTIIEQKKWKEDIPRIVQGVLSRQRKGIWDTTTANAFGMLSMEKFSKEFERIDVSGKTDIALADEKKFVDWSESAKTSKVSFPHFSGQKELTAKHDGSGNPWMTVQSQAAIPLKTPLFAGYRLEKTLVAIEQKNPGIWSKGDIVRVKLKISADSPKTWVVISDPIPAGSSIMGTGLGKESAIFSDENRKGGWLAYEEKSFEGYRAYYQYLPEGEATIEYTLRLNQEGEFVLPTTRIEAMYFPEMFGELPNPKFTVGK